MSGYRSSCSEAHALFVLILAIFNGMHLILNYCIVCSTLLNLTRVPGKSTVLER